MNNQSNSKNITMVILNQIIYPFYHNLNLYHHPHLHSHYHYYNHQISHEPVNHGHHHHHYHKSPQSASVSLPFSSSLINQQQAGSVLAASVSTSTVLAGPSTSTITNDHSLADTITNVTVMDTVVDESVFELWRVEYILIICFYSLILLIGLAGNLLVCRVAFGSKQMRTTTNLLIASLACSDIVMIVFNIPFNVIRILPISWPFWSGLCVLAPLIQYSCVYVSTFTMTLIALHRLWMIRQRSTTIGKSSWQKLTLTVFGIWLMAFSLSAPHASFNVVKEKIFHGRLLFRCMRQLPRVSFNVPLLMTVEVFITQYLLPLSITLIVYIKIGIVIARQGALICKLSDERKRRQSEAKRRRIFMLAIAVATFATCWAPINLSVLLVDLGVVDFNQTAFIMCHWFAMSSVCYNPIIYCWLNEKFRNGAKQSLLQILEIAHLTGKRSIGNSGIGGNVLAGNCLTTGAGNRRSGSGIRQRNSITNNYSNHHLTSVVNAVNSATNTVINVNTNTNEHRLSANVTGSDGSDNSANISNTADLNFETGTNINKQYQYLINTNNNNSYSNSNGNSTQIEQVDIDEDDDNENEDEDEEENKRTNTAGSTLYTMITLNNVNNEQYSV